MTVDALPDAPDPAIDTPTVFSQKAAASVLAQKAMVPQINAAIANLNTIAAGGAYAIPYVFDSTTADADPTAGLLRLSSATQNASTVMRLDLLGAGGIDWTSVLDTFDASSSAVKGQLRLAKMGDATKFLTFNVTARAAPTGYRNMTVVNTGGSSASPFIAGDAVMLFFTRTGDMGVAGSVAWRVTSIVSSATPAPNATTDDLFQITAQAATATFGSPGTPANGTRLAFRIKDNGTAQALVWNVIFRSSSDLALPTSTVGGKWTYVGFIYNAVDSKWDIAGVLGNI
jgi:hypothetical protein